MFRHVLLRDILRNAMNFIRFSYLLPTQREKEAPKPFRVQASGESSCQVGSSLARARIIARAAALKCRRSEALSL